MTRMPTAIEHITIMTRARMLAASPLNPEAKP